MKTLKARQALAASLAGVLLLTTGLPTANAEDTRDVLGVAHAAGRYNFTGTDYLNEGADRLLELGTRVIKVFLVPGLIQDFYSFNSDWSPPSTDAVDLIGRPYFHELFAKPFSTYLLVVVPVTGSPQFLDGLTREEAAAEQDQMYRLAKHLLTAYAGTGKTFVLQNWEGDHLLYSGLTGDAQPDEVRVRGMIDWWNARQDGVRQARQEVGERDVQVLHGAEVNFLDAAMKGRVTATNDVIPATRCDLYSYSSWDLGFTPQDLTRALDYLEAKAPDNKRFGRRNLYLGEIGMAKDQGAAEGERYDRIRRLLEAALGWGVRYAVYWQVYCNEPFHDLHGRPKNRDMRGFWLIRPDGQKAPLWEMLEEQLKTTVQQVSLASFSNQYFSVGGSDRAVSAAAWIRGGVWETFTLKDWNGGALMNGDVVTLQAHDGLYLSVDGGVGGRVFARTSLPAKAERLIVHEIGGAGPIEPGDSLTLLAARSKRYLAPEMRGQGAIRALRTAAGAAEVFRWVKPED